MNSKERMEQLESIRRDFTLSHLQRVALAWAVAALILKERNSKK